MSDLSTLGSATKRFIPDPDGIVSDTRREEAVTDAVRRYSRDNPREIDAKLTGDGSQTTFAASGITSWETGFSDVRYLEWPVGNQPRSFLPPNENIRQLVEDQVHYLETQRFTLDTDEEMRLVFTALHTIDSDSTTVPSRDQDAVVALAASFLARQLAAHYGEQTDATLADTVDHAGKAAEFTSLAEELEGVYYRKIVGTAPAPGSVGLVFGELDSRPSHHGRWFWRRPTQH